MKTLHVVIALTTAMFACVLLKAAPGSGGAGSSSADPPPADHMAIREVAEAWVARYNAGDSVGVSKLYTEDGFYVSAHILAHGREQIEKYWDRGIAAGGHLDFVRPVEIHAEGDLGYFLGMYQATNAGRVVDGRIVIVAKRREGRWQIAVHETVVRDQPE